MFTMSVVQIVPTPTFKCESISNYFHEKNKKNVYNLQIERMWIKKNMKKIQSFSFIELFLVLARENQRLYISRLGLSVKENANEGKKH